MLAAMPFFQSQHLYFLSFLKEYQLVEGIELPNFIANRMLLEKRDYISYKRGKPALPKVGAPGGPCTPGENKFFVNYNGDIYPCERVSEISECMHIGTLDTGFDYDKIKKLLNWDFILDVVGGLCLCIG